MTGETRANETGTDGKRAAPPRKRRRWLRWLIVLLVLLAVLLAAAPSLLSTNAAVGFVTDLVNDRIQGRIEIDELSLGWFTPGEVRGLRVIDAAGKEVLRVESARLSGGLARRIANGEAFDLIEVDSARVILQKTADGEYSLLKALSAREGEQDEEEDEEENDGRPSQVRGRILLRNASVVLVQLDGRRYELSQINCRIDLDTLDRIAGELSLQPTGGGTLSADFKLSQLTRDGKLRLDGLTGRLTVKTDGRADLAPLGEFALTGQRLAGKLSVRADVSFTEGRPEGDFDVNVAGLQAARGPSDIVTPIDVRLTGRSAIAGKIVSGAIDLTSQCGRVGGAFRFDTSDIPKGLSAKQILATVLEGKPLGLPEFSLDANGQIDLPQLARAVPALLQIRPDVTVTAGMVRIEGVSVRGGASPSSRGRITLTDLTARRGPREIRWRPTVVQFDAEIVPGKGLATRVLRAESGFGSLNVSGTPAAFDGVYRLDLKALHEQVGDIFDLGPIALAGSAAGKLSGGIEKDEHLRARFDSALTSLSYREDGPADRGALDVRLNAALNATADISLAEDRYESRFDANVTSLAASQGPTELVRPVDLRLTGNALLAGKALQGWLSLNGPFGRLDGALSYDTDQRFPEITGQRILAAVLEGKPLGLPGIALDANGQIDLPQLARTVPALLKLRPDVTIVGGTIRLEDCQLRGGPAPAGHGRLALADLTVRRDQRIIQLPPATANFDAEIVPGKGLTIRAMNAESSFGEFRAGGSPEGFKATWGVELAGLYVQLHKIFEMGQTGLIGAAEGTLTAAVGKGRRLHGSLDASLQSVVYRQSTGKLVVDSASLTGRGELSYADAKDIRLAVTDGKLNVDDELLATAGGSFRLSHDAFDLRLAVQRCLLADLARRGKVLGEGRLEGLTGDAIGEMTIGRASADKPLTAAGQLTVREPKWDGNSISDQDIRLILANARLTPQTGALAVDEIRLTSDPATLTANGVDVRFDKELRLAGKVDLAADLARCFALAARFRGQEKPTPISGRLTWSGRAATAAGITDLSGQGQIADAVVGPADKTAKAVRLGRVAFRQEARIDAKAETIDLKAVELTSEPLTLRAAGTIGQYRTGQVLDISGHYRGDWDRLIAVLHALAPETADAVLAGPVESDFRLTGPARRPTLRPAYRDVQGNTAVGWASARLAGFELGRAELPMQFADGKFHVPLTDIDANGGTVRVGATVDLRPETPLLQMPGRTTVLQNVPVNPEVAEKLLTRFNPIFGQLVGLDGNVTLTVQDLELPLGPEIKTAGAGTGRLDLSEMNVRPGGLMAALLALGGIAENKTQIMEVRGADFEIKDGGIQYEHFALVFNGDFDLEFRGVVRFDDALDLAVTVPVRAALLEKLGVTGRVADYARMLEGARIEIPIVGTRLSARPDLTRIDVRPLIKKAVEALISEEAGSLLDGFLRPRADDGGGDQPRQSPGPETQPATQPAPKKPKPPEQQIIESIFDLLTRPKPKDPK